MTVRRCIVKLDMAVRMIAYVARMVKNALWLEQVTAVLATSQKLACVDSIKIDIRQNLRLIRMYITASRNEYG